MISQKSSQTRLVDSDDGDDDKDKKKENIWLVTLYECAGGSTLHGVSHICYPGRIGFKKIIWLWVFCVAMFYFVRHTRESVIKYFEYPHITGQYFTLIRRPN